MTAINPEFKQETLATRVKFPEGCINEVKGSARSERMHCMRKVFLACLLFTASAVADDAPAYRELPCHVVDETGRPVRGVAVRLGGLERDAPDFEDDEDQIDKEPGWKFTTDNDGRFTARFGQFHPYQHLGADGAYAGPGYGKFYFLVEKAGFAGGVSREILNLDDEAHARLQADAYEQGGVSWDDQEWRRGEFAPLLLRDDQPIREPLVIVLKRGLEVRGRMVDTAGRPVRGQGIGLSLDLHYGSHTGAGGMIFWQGTTTDRAGCFHLRHVYPNVFTILAADGDDGPLYWIKTRVRGVLPQVGAVWISRQEHAHRRCCQTLFAQLLPRPDGVRGHRLPQLLQVLYWLAERTRAADVPAIRDDLFEFQTRHALQFHRHALDHDSEALVQQSTVGPREMSCRVDAQGRQALFQPSRNAPQVDDRPFVDERFSCVAVVIEHIDAASFFGVPVRQLGQRLRRCDADADGDTSPLAHRLPELVAVSFQRRRCRVSHL